MPHVGYGFYPLRRNISYKRIAYKQSKYLRGGAYPARFKGAQGAAFERQARSVRIRLYRRGRKARNIYKKHIG